MKVKTGINGLDKLVDNGIPQDSIVLLSGSAGCGKTIFSLQFLVHGAKQKERSLYLTFEEEKNKIIDQAKQFGWDLQNLEKNNLLVVKSLDSVGIVEILESIKTAINTTKPKRLVIDSITFMSLAASSMRRTIDLDKTSVAEIYERMEDQSIQDQGLVLRKLMTDFVKYLQSKQITTILTSEVSKESVWYSRDTFTEFACDGIIHLKSTSIGPDVQRTLEVVKMRNTKIKGGIHTFDFTKDGLKVNV